MWFSASVTLSRQPLLEPRFSRRLPLTPLFRRLLVPLCQPEQWRTLLEVTANVHYNRATHKRLKSKRWVYIIKPYLALFVWGAGSPRASHHHLWLAHKSIIDVVWKIMSCWDYGGFSNMLILEASQTLPVIHRLELLHNSGLCSVSVRLRTWSLIIVNEWKKKVFGWKRVDCTLVNEVVNYQY